MERRITLNNNVMKKKNGNNNFENVGNEKQNSLTSGIRIGLDGNFPVECLFKCLIDPTFKRFGKPIANYFPCGTTEPINTRAFNSSFESTINTSIFYLNNPIVVRCFILSIK
jgi:hypothetical protein